MDSADDTTAAITAWIEENLGGKVRHVERQARWRPVWWVSLEQDNEMKDLCVRGERIDSPSAFPLKHEMVFQSILQDNDIPVARVHGWCDRPRAIVMDRVPGRDNFEDVAEDERRRAMEDYIDVLVRMHRLDVRQFSDAGIVRAARPAESDRIGLQHFENLAYRAMKKRPDPFLEFALGWLARNRVDNEGRESAIVWDAGQFHHLDGRIVAVLDLEFAHVGDPMMDLGGIWTRNAFIPFGDVTALFLRYQDRSGRPVDLASVQYHYILWALSNPIEFHAVLADPVPGADYMLNLHWVIESNLLALEGIAHVMNIEFEAVQEPDPIHSPFGPAHRHLTKSLENYPLGSGYHRYRHRMSIRLVRHLERIEELGAPVVKADLDDLQRLFGRRPDSWEESEIELEQFVLSDNCRRDAELVQLFHRRLHRARMLCGPAGSWITQHRVVGQPNLKPREADLEQP
jgi:aminoglycoside phosphotransferase (APT) family kinase protein